jgi:hypothetical protein
LAPNPDKFGAKIFIKFLLIHDISCPKLVKKLLAAQRDE